MTHKVIIRLKSIKNAAIGDSSIWTAAIWHLLDSYDSDMARKLHNSNEVKGFVWSINSVGAGEFDLEFASIVPEIIDAFCSGAQKSMESNTAFAVAGDVILKVIDIQDVEDFKTCNGEFRLSTVSCLTIDREAITSTGNKGRALVKPDDDRIYFTGRVKKNLMLKINKFFPDSNIKDEDVRVQIIYTGRQIARPFRNIPLRGYYLGIKIKGPKVAIDTALYAGLGRSNGLGFGMMVPMSKKFY